MSNRIDEIVKIKNILRIKIDTNANNSLRLDEVKYVFKTICLTIGIPWHFLNSLEEDNIDIYYGANKTIKAGLRINANLKKDVQINRQPELIVSKDIVFFNFLKDFKIYCIEELNEGEIVINNDLIYTIFYLITGKDEVNISRNRWDQHDVLQSFLHQNNLLHLPVFNTYTAIIETFFLNKYEFIPKWKDGKKAALALSHDTDYPEMIKSIEILRYVLKNKGKSKIKTIFDIVNGKNNFWKFDDYMRLEKKYGAKSAFYFCSFKGSLPRFFFIAPDTFYNIKKRKAEFKLQMQLLG